MEIAERPANICSLPTSSCDAMDTSIPFAQPPVDLYIIRMTMIVEKSMLLIFSDRTILGEIRTW